MNITFDKKDAPQHTIDVLDGVRAFACFSVISYHVNLITLRAHLWNADGIGQVLANAVLAGYSGVTLFFLLSGFLLFMTYCRSLLFDYPWQSARKFYLRRIFRIWPGYYISLGLLILLAHREYLQPDHFWNLSLFLTFLMDSHSSTFQQLNGPFWTLAVEWQFYMLLPLFALVFRRFVQHGTLRRRVIMLMLCLGGLFLWGVVTRWWGDALVRDGQPVAILPEPFNGIVLFLIYGRSGKYLEDFAVGMMVCTVYILVTYHPGLALGRFVRRWSTAFWIAGVLCLLFAATWPYWSYLNVSAFANPIIGAGRSLSELPFSSGFALCMLALLFGARWLTWFWRWGPIRGLGLLSYGLYIWHLPFIKAFDSFVFPYLQALQNLWVYLIFWLMIAVVVIPFSYLFYRLIELPWIDIGRRVIKRRPLSRQTSQGSVVPGSSRSS